MQRSATDLGIQPLGRLLVKLSIPGMLGMLVMALYNIVDTFWVARLGGTAIAALTVNFPLQMIAGAVGIGTGVGVASLVARRLGQARGQEVNDIGGQVIIVPLSSGVVIALVSLLIPRQLLHLFGATEEIAELARAYLTAVAFGFPFLLFTMTANGLYRGLGNTLTPMVIMATSSGINLFLDPLLIFGIGPFPALGVQGAGLATAISQFAASLLSVSYLFSARSGYRIRLPNLRVRYAILVDIAQVGGPTALMHIGQSLVLSIFNWVLGGFGAVAIAAYGLTFRVTMLIFPIVAGVNQGLLPIVGFNFGAKQYRRMWHALKLAAAATSLIGLGIGVLIWIAATPIVQVFTREPELVELTVIAVRLVVLALWLVGPQIMAVSTLQGMGRGTEAMLLNFARQIIFVIPGLLILSHTFGVVGAFAARPVADLLGFLATAIYIRMVYCRHRPELDVATAAHPQPAEVSE